MDDIALRGIFDLAQKGINARDAYNNTPLILAAASGQGDVALGLIDRGADVNARNTGEDTPLSWAAFHGQKNVVEALIEKGADVNDAKNGKAPALFWAALNGHADVVRVLVDKGADVNSALTWAAGCTARSYTDAVKILEEAKERAEENTPQRLVSFNRRLADTAAKL